jgi:hypothetical protein
MAYEIPCGHCGNPESAHYLGVGDERDPELDHCVLELGGYNPEDPVREAIEFLREDSEGQGRTMPFGGPRIETYIRKNLGKVRTAVRSTKDSLLRLSLSNLVLVIKKRGEEVFA